MAGTVNVDPPLAVYLVRGDDPGLRGQAARDLVHRLVGDGDTSLMVEEHQPSTEVPDTAAIADAAQTPPFLTERRVVVVRDVGAPDFREHMRRVTGRTLRVPALSERVANHGGLIASPLPRTRPFEIRSRRSCSMPAACVLIT